MAEQAELRRHAATVLLCGGRRLVQPRKTPRLPDGNALYWARFLNVPLYVLLVWLSYLLTKRLFPASLFLQLGVPFVLAVFPQDVFYSLNNDVLFRAPCHAIALPAVENVSMRESRSGTRRCVVVESAVVFSSTKSTNVPILVVLGLAGIAILARSWRRNEFLASVAAVSLLIGQRAFPSDAGWQETTSFWTNRRA